jgi:hypothetical protein
MYAEGEQKQEPQSARALLPTACDIYRLAGEEKRKLSMLRLCAWRERTSQQYPCGSNHPAGMRRDSGERENGAAWRE